MDGRIWLESREGYGTTFHFTVGLEPAATVEQTGAAQEEETDAGDSRLQNVRVLIADDNSTDRLLLERWLHGWGIACHSVDSGPAALAALEKESFHLVLLDAQMPVMDGFQVAAEIRQHRSSAEIKIVILNSVATKGGSLPRRELDIDAYLTKPLRQGELLQTARRLFAGESAGHAAALPGSIAQTRLPESASSLSRLSSLRILVAEDNLVNQTLARRLLEKQGHIVTMVANGRAAVQTFAQNEFDLILMDIQMPELNGYEATQAIRNCEGSNRRTPIIALTAHAMSSDRERSLAAGMDGYVSKPINVGELMAVMSLLCSGCQGAAPAPHHRQAKTDGHLLPQERFSADELKRAC